MSLASGNWNYPTTIWFGNGRIEELPLACAELGILKPLFVTDEGLVKLPVVTQTLAVLQRAGVQHGVYSDVQGNPSARNVTRGVEQFRAGGHDGVIAFGGGSALDAAKTIALLAGQTAPLWDFVDEGDNWKRVDTAAMAPVIAVPTTAGTGSEVGRAAVILDESSCAKRIIFHPRMLPDIVIADPQLTVGLPPNLTAWTGVDALVHALEAYCAPGFHPLADGIAVEAIRLIKQWLPLAVREGNNLDARGHMLVAASMGATAFQKGLGSVHSVSHVLGALYNVHHGLANAVILPYGLCQNGSVIDARMDHLCTVLSLPGSGTAGVIDYVLQLRRELNIPHSLGELDINADRASEIGELAWADPCTASNAKALQPEDLQQLFRAAVAGDLTLLQS